MTNALAAIYGIQEQVTKNVSSIFSKEDVFKLLSHIEGAAQKDMDNTPAPEESPTQDNNLEMLIDQIKAAIEERIEEIELGVSDIDYAQFECDGDRIQVSEIEFDGAFKDEAYRDIIERIDQLVKAFEDGE